MSGFVLCCYFGTLKMLSVFAMLVFLLYNRCLCNVCSR